MINSCGELCYIYYTLSYIVDIYEMSSTNLEFNKQKNLVSESSFETSCTVLHFIIILVVQRCHVLKKCWFFLYGFYKQRRETIIKTYDVSTRKTEIEKYIYTV